jgi:tRNA 5-methylaminomethyl-2-thiouridine biosynthesis bifunctional protein
LKTEPIVAAEVDFASDPAAPRAPAFGDVYHPREGALAQAREVFLAGNGLPQRWQGRTRFVILETGFGLGHNFLAAWAAWRDDPARCERLHFVSLEKHPLARDDLQRALARAPWPHLARELIDAWPALTPNLHRLDFESGRVRLQLAFGEAAVVARELVADVDAFFLDGFAPARNADMWSPPLFAALARLAARDATAATWSAARAVRDGLTKAGFEVRAAPGPGPKRDITLARYAPRFVPVRPPGRALPAAPSARALVVGAGLAGASTARALARLGVACTVLDRHDQPASQASGNPAGLFHGTVGRDDGPHMRWHRAASFVAARWVREARAAGVACAADGLLRVNAGLRIEDMQALLHAQRLPTAYVTALDAGPASALAGVPLRQPAWHFTEGGWADPAASVRWALATAGVTWRGNSPVHALRRAGDGWQALDAQGGVLAEAPVVVLANAEDALRLAGLPAAWVRRNRGQLSWLDREALALAAPQLPIASGRYLLPLPDGRLLFGATQHADDDDPQLRDADHRANLEGAEALLGGRQLARDGAALHGRVGWRVGTVDRLPLIGAAPDLAAPLPARRDAPRLVARQPGLYLHCALGSRGLTTAALGAELVAAQIVGTPWPLEADLVDALDPARFALRRSADEAQS